MHGLINRSIQCFLRDTYGPDIWLEIARLADFEEANFEALMQYPDEVTSDILTAATARLGKETPELLEDLGTYLVSDPSVRSLRRLLRFGGTSFSDFLHSLDDLEGRARLAVPELETPSLNLRVQGPGRFSLRCIEVFPGTGYVLVGMLRAMADDYGALVLLDHLGTKSSVSVIEVQLLDNDYADGREFALAVGAS